MTMERAACDVLAIPQNALNIVQGQRYHYNILVKLI
jgi:hypothetical protein